MVDRQVEVAVSLENFLAGPANGRLYCNRDGRKYSGYWHMSVRTSSPLATDPELCMVRIKLTGFNRSVWEITGKQLALVRTDDDAIIQLLRLADCEQGTAFESVFDFNYGFRLVDA